MAKLMGQRADEGSLLALFAEQVAKGDKEAAVMMFREASSLVRSRLAPADAEIIAMWFDRLAAGEKADDVLFGERRGRKKGALKKVFIRGKEVEPPDDVTLVWMMRDAIEKGGKPDAVFKDAAETFGRTADHYKRLFKKIAPTLSPRGI